MTNIAKYVDLFSKLEQPIKISFNNDDWKKMIPSKAGIYYIRTNTPFIILESLEHNGVKYNYDIAKRITANKGLSKYSLLNLPTQEDNCYIAYIGHSANLKARSREHIKGGNGTACLSLASYSKLSSYEWYFHFVTVKDLINETDSCAFRVALEQGLRTKFGWPILCNE